MRNIKHHIKHHIERMQGKSKTQQHAVALSIAIVFTLFVFVLWYFISLPEILRNYEINKSEVKRLNSSPIDNFKDRFTAGNEEDYNTESINIDITE